MATFKLKYQKNGSGGYVDVPVGASQNSLAALVYVGGTNGGGTGASYSVSLNGTLTGGIASSPSEGDLIIVACGHGGTASSAPTCSGNQTGSYTGAHTALYSNDTWDTNFRAFYAFAGATPDTTLTIGRTNNTTYGGHSAVHVWRNVNTTNPFDVTTTTNSANNQSASRPNPPSITPSTTGAVILAAGAGMQTTSGAAFTIPSGMTNGQSGKTDGSTSDCGTFIASFAWTSGAYDPAAVTGGTTSTSGSHASCTMALRPATITTYNEVYIATSSNIAAGGEATTARLTDPGTSSFVTGRRWDDENGTDSITLGNDEYTEIEWKIGIDSPGTTGDYYEFRVYDGDTPLDTYTVTPKWTIGEGAVSHDLAGAAAAAGAASGDLPIGKTQAGDATGAGSAEATLGSVHGIAGEAVGAGAAAGDPSKTATAAGGADAAGEAAGGLAVEKPLSGAATGGGAAAADVEKIVGFDAAAAGAGAAAGDLSRIVALQIEAPGGAAVAGDLSVVVSLSAAAQAGALAAAELWLDNKLAAAVESSALAAGDLSVAANLAGAAVGSGDAAATLTAQGEIALAGAAEAAGEMGGELSIEVRLQAAAQAAGEAAAELLRIANLQADALVAAGAGAELSVATMQALAGDAQASGLASAEIAKTDTIDVPAAYYGSGLERRVREYWDRLERERAAQAAAIEADDAEALELAAMFLHFRKAA